MYTWKQLLNKAHSLQARLPITKLRKVWSHFDVARQLSNICIPSTALPSWVGGQIEPYILWPAMYVCTQGLAARVGDVN